MSTRGFSPNADSEGTLGRAAKRWATGFINNLTTLVLNLVQYTETVYAPAAGSAFTVDLANGTKQRFTTNANTTITLPAAVAGKSYLVEIVYGGTHTVTFAGGTAIAWAGGTAPTATAVSGKRDKYVFDCTSASQTDGADAGRNY